MEAKSAFILIEFSSPLESQHASIFFKARMKVAQHHCIISNVSGVFSPSCFTQTNRTRGRQNSTKQIALKRLAVSSLSSFIFHTAAPFKKRIQRATMGRETEKMQGEREAMRSSSLTELLLHIKRCCPHAVAGAVCLSAHYLHSRLNALCLPVNIKHK